MKVTCNKCKKEFDDFVFGDNKKGFEERLLSHIEQHQNDTKLGDWFTNTIKAGGSN